ncbi:hypothetical protein K2173_011887 [Erythroxylum novogranatense]|uniref:Uncharacterized protein n=1 Tax=Erythroxylum novogranatense TaxID=1862640 RepID=A0AAV8T2J2_9ROSI|nr:hypothetical protein K2173_011887 [Erythroxylum novogranatense]
MLGLESRYRDKFRSIRNQLTWGPTSQRGFTGESESESISVLRLSDPISVLYSHSASKMFDDQDLGFFANFLVIAYHYVMADPKYEGN